MRLSLRPRPVHRSDLQARRARAVRALTRRRDQRPDLAGGAHDRSAALGERLTKLLVGCREDLPAQCLEQVVEITVRVPLCQCTSQVRRWRSRARRIRLRAVS